MFNKEKFLLGLSSIGLASSTAVLAWLSESPVVWLSCASLICLAVCAASVAKMFGRRLWALEESMSAKLREASIETTVELHAMQVLMSRFPQLQLPTTGWSMRFANLHQIVQVMDSLRPQTVVEFGSGMTSLCVAAWFKEQGRGRLISFDHDQAWAQLTQNQLERFDLDPYVAMFVSPLSPSAMAPKAPWYHIHSDALEGLAVDLVIVDGPPAGAVGHEMARLPAMEKLYSHLSDNAVVVLDDANRPGEQRVVLSWLKAYPEFHYELRGGPSGLAVLTRGVRSVLQTVENQQVRETL